MARRKKRAELESPGASWMVTFADLMTLLLSFFVLLLSMSSMDKSILRDVVSHFVGDMGLAPKKGAGRLTTKFEFMNRIIENPAEALHDPQRIKDLLFPDEVLPEGMARSTLNENLQILVRPEGIALVLSDGMLFGVGESALTEDSRKLLSEFAQFLASVTMPVNVAGYTDNIPAGQKDNYMLSSERAMSVLTFFLQQGFDPRRFSVSAYGEAFPLGDNATPEGRAKNRRVEILLKTTGRTYL
ncbi:OmpA/MotB family protein [Desulfomicrobium baculatum]|uniref:OmpA/MotB domain protein n=1 Tax=Desulfomicrobium baculatum (strain DSM 4028 / VKM B-1378 / X) TaxID=525897 RepID=C7LTP6_DESBD|nr:flagellar motor protein MotB [Desulfomicrobium baculatum]ACU90812.1 OmpA/MotB domain protein [Desulfomicrobium baculatum DSM 4028]